MPHYIVTHNCGQTRIPNAENADEARAVHIYQSRTSGGLPGERVIHGIVEENVEHRARPARGAAYPLPLEARDKLEAVTKAANLERCALDVPDEVVRYLETWVVFPLRELLRWDNGELSIAALNDDIPF